MRCQEDSGLLAIVEQEPGLTVYECRKCHQQYAWYKVKEKTNED